ncbi:CPBP family intramembrane glutamic endopeptidase [Streptomonospora arabica]|uniref:CPBP family intramembrane glutamic endopeptidase n=1 Tax=Streptomonospora arabica TaxID=412417 RepID=A0ABV9ST33_9ACTN
MFPGMAPHPTSARPDSAASATPEDPARTAVMAPRGLTAYFVIAFAFSWIAWWAGARLIGGGNPLPAVLVGGFGPAVAAVAVTWATLGRSGVGALFRRYSIGRRGLLTPYLVAASAVAAVAASAAVPIYLEGTAVDGAQLRAALALAPANFLLIALAGGGNEELGWRGFAQPRLQGALSPLAANAVLGGVWAVWHAPLFGMEGTVQSTMYFPAYALLCVGLTVVLGCVFNSARGGLLATVFAHTAVNVVSGLKGAAVGDAAGAGEVALVGLAAVVLALATRGNLALRRPRGAEDRSAD